MSPQHLLIIYYVPDNVLGTKDIVVNNIKSSPLWGLYLADGSLSNKLAKKKKRGKWISDRKWQREEPILVWAVQEGISGEIPYEMSLDIREEPVILRSGKSAEVQQVQSPWGGMNMACWEKEDQRWRQYHGSMRQSVGLSSSIYNE